MIKNIFFILIIAFYAITSATPTYACDPLGCLMGGSKQDTLVLGEVIATNGDTADVQILFVFPQNHVTDLRVGDQITVEQIPHQTDPTSAIPDTIAIDKKYLWSLNKSDTGYVAAWGIHEVIGTGYADARLVHNTSIDDQALEIFIQSGGTERDFGFDYSGFRPVLILNGHPLPAQGNAMLWYGAGLGIVACMIAILLIRKTRQK